MIERMKVIRSAVFDLPLCLGLSVLATIIDEYAKKMTFHVKNVGR